MRRLVFHHTPKYGSWLPMAELKFRVLSRQCWAWRISTKATLVRGVATLTNYESLII